MRFPRTDAAKREGRFDYGRVDAVGVTEAIAESEASPNARIGHVHLRVADLEHAAEFYREVLGFEITFYGPSVGLSAVFLAGGDYHHHIALNTFHGAGGTPPPPGHTGLHHFAILYPDKISLARAVARVFKRGYPIDDARDHGGTLSAYLRDSDGNGIEFYYDRPRSEWFDSQGQPSLNRKRSTYASGSMVLSFVHKGVQEAVRRGVDQFDRCREHARRSPGGRRSCSGCGASSEVTGDTWQLSS